MKKLDLVKATALAASLAPAMGLAELERRYIEKTLARLGGNRERTAEALGINKTTLWRRLQRYEDQP